MLRVCAHAQVCCVRICLQPLDRSSPNLISTFVLMIALKVMATTTLHALCSVHVAVAVAVGVAGAVDDAFKAPDEPFAAVHVIF